MISGGYILLSRKLLNSEIMDKPPLFFKLWGWMLLQAKFKADKNLECGQFVTSISAMREAMAYYVGYRKVTPTAKQIRVIYESLTKGSMIGTVKVTHGLLITILNYKEYQNPKNYEGHNERAHEGNRKGTPLYKDKNDKKEYTDKSKTFVRRYIKFISDNYPTKAPKGKDIESTSLQTIDQLIRIDGFDEEYIFETLRWAKDDEFWKTNVFSLAGLRKKKTNGLTKFQNLSNAFDKDKPEQAKPKILAFEVDPDDR